jgi:hypothetical protein
MKLTSLIAAIFLMAGAAWCQDPPSRVARLNLLNGAVSFQPASVDEWTSATLNYPLTTGDHLYADQGARAEMHIGSNAIRLNAQTNFGFLNLDDQTAQVRLTQGSLGIRLRNLSDADAWEIDTPNGAISLLRTGEYRIDTDADRNATMVTVRSGEVEVTANGQSFPVRRGETAFFTGDGTQPDVKSANPDDSFDSFCFDRDRREDTLAAPRYVSRDMVGYEDLDANGSWSEVPDYGPVWRPRAVAVGWAPYHDGHWAWVEPWGWTWIDDAPWGFAPFHYGRWAFVGGGWGWCPGPVLVARPVYAPALVAFVGGGGFGVGVAWFPLGPREIYVPSYHHSDVYVRHVNVMNVTNINTVNITEINVNRVYMNQRVPGAVVAVSRADFAGARSVSRVAVRVDANTMASARVATMGPGVAPERVSVFGRAGGQLNVARPSEAVFNRPVIARAAPPPPPVAFAAKQQALQANGGRPLDPNAIHTLQQSQAQVARPAIRSASQIGSPAIGGFGRSAQPAQQPVPANQNNGFGRQQDRMNSRPPAAQPPPAVQQVPANPNNGFGRGQDRQPQQDRMNSRPPSVQQPPPAVQQAPANPNNGFGRGPDGQPQQDRMNSRPPSVQQPPPAVQQAPANPNNGFGRGQAVEPKQPQQDRMNSHPPAPAAQQPSANPDGRFGRAQERPQAAPAPQSKAAEKPAEKREPKKDEKEKPKER